MSDGRRWLELSVGSLGDDDLDALLTEGLMSLGGRAAEERGGRLVTHLPEPDDLERFMAEATEALRGSAGGREIEVRAEWRAHEEWAETWRRGLGPRRLTDRLVVRPSWEQAPDPRPGDVVVVLDPGMAFGTAEHGTTRGCLRLLDRVVAPGDRVLDVGAGSGILSIAAALLGAAEVLAVELDPLACEALVENVERNGTDDRVAMLEFAADPSWLAAQDPRDGLVANIETGILLPLLEGFAAALKPGGWLILSGILDHEWAGLRAAAEARDLSWVEVDEDGMWRSGLFRKGSGPGHA